MDRADLSQLNVFIRSFCVDAEYIVLGGVIEQIARLITLIWDSWSQMPVELFHSLSYGVQVASPMDTKAIAVTKYGVHRLQWAPSSAKGRKSLVSVLVTPMDPVYIHRRIPSPMLYGPQAWRTKWISVVQSFAKSVGAGKRHEKKNQRGPQAETMFIG